MTIGSDKSIWRSGINFIALIWTMLQWRVRWGLVGDYIHKARKHTISNWGTFSIGNVHIRQYANAVDGVVNSVELTANNISAAMIKVWMLKKGEGGGPRGGRGQEWGVRKQEITIDWSVGGLSQWQNKHHPSTVRCRAVASSLSPKSISVSL